MYFPLTKTNGLFFFVPVSQQNKWFVHLDTFVTVLFGFLPTNKFHFFGLLGESEQTICYLHFFVRVWSEQMGFT